MAVLARLFVLLVFVPIALCQNLEFSGGWAHLTSDFGVDGFQVGVASWFSPKISVALNYDDTWDTSRVGTFELTSTGEISTKNHLQNFLVGPRVFLSKRKFKKYTFDPFGEAQFGLSHLNTTLQQVSVGQQSASDTAFSWALGGGADLVMNRHWAARANLDFLRTHFAETGQSRLRLVMGVAYTFGSRQ
jgi:opacity protein-like surface antigen